MSRTVTAAGEESAGLETASAAESTASGSEQLETAETILMDAILVEQVLKLGRMGGYIGARDAFNFETRVRRWTWRVMKDFNITKKADSRGNPTLERVTAGFCKIRLGIVQASAKDKVHAARLAIQRQFRIDHYNQPHKNKEITKEGTKNGAWTLPFIMMVQEHMRHFCKDLPMIQYNPSRHHQKALQKHVEGNSEQVWIETQKDAEMPQPRVNRKRKATGISTTEAPPKYRTIVIEKRANVRKQMLAFLNKYHQGSNGEDEYEMPNYLKEEDTHDDDKGGRDDEGDDEVQSFGGDDL